MCVRGRGGRLCVKEGRGGSVCKGRGRGGCVCVCEGEGCEEELWEWTEVVGSRALPPPHSRRVIS